MNIKRYSAQRHIEIKQLFHHPWHLIETALQKEELYNATNLYGAEGAEIVDLIQ